MRGDERVRCYELRVPFLGGLWIVANALFHLESN